MVQSSTPIRTTSVGSVQKHPDFAKQVIYTDDIVEFIRHVFLNEEYEKPTQENPLGKWVTRKLKDGTDLKPLMKEEYINDLLSHLRMNLTRTMLLSKMEKHEINNMLLITANDIDVWFAMNWKKAEISKEVYYSDILSDSLINLLQGIMKMPQDGSIQEFFKETYKINEISNPNAPQQKGISLPTFFTKPGGN